MTIAYRLPDALRGELGGSNWPVVDEATCIAGVRDGTYGAPVITVGDVVTDTLLRHGLTPDVMVFDLITKRDDIGDAMKARLEGHDSPLIEVTSEPATISHALVEAMRSAIEADEPVRIKVDGEEDLAVLPAIDLAPLGGTVIYGMPNQGLVPVPVGNLSKDRVRGWLSLMKVAPGP